jgi:hypothetical protein
MQGKHANPWVIENASALCACVAAYLDSRTAEVEAAERTLQVGLISEVDLMEQWRFTKQATTACCANIVSVVIVSLMHGVLQNQLRCLDPPLLTLASASGHRLLRRWWALWLSSSTGSSVTGVRSGGWSPRR